MKFGITYILIFLVFVFLIFNVNTVYTQKAIKPGVQIYKPKIEVPEYFHTEERFYNGIFSVLYAKKNKPFEMKDEESMKIANEICAKEFGTDYYNPETVANCANKMGTRYVLIPKIYLLGYKIAIAIILIDVETGGYIGGISSQVNFDMYSPNFDEKVKELANEFYFNFQEYLLNHSIEPEALLKEIENKYPVSNSFINEVKLYKILRFDEITKTILEKEEVSKPLKNKDTICIHIKLNNNGYVYIYHKDTYGDSDFILPNENENNFLEKEKPKYSCYVVGKPFGIDNVYIIATSYEIDFNETLYSFLNFKEAPKDKFFNITNNIKKGLNKPLGELNEGQKIQNENNSFNADFIWQYKILNFEVKEE